MDPNSTAYDWRRALPFLVQQIDMTDLDLDGERPVKNELPAASKMYYASVRLRQVSNPFRDVSTSLLLQVLIEGFVSIREL